MNRNDVNRGLIAIMEALDANAETRRLLETGLMLGGYTHNDARAILAIGERGGLLAEWACVPAGYPAMFLTDAGRAMLARARERANIRRRDCGCPLDAPYHIAPCKGAGRESWRPV